MDPRVKRKTEELAEALAESQEYRNLVAAREALEEHEAAKIMLRDLVSKQQRLQEKMMQGGQPTEAEMADYQRTAEVVSMNPYVRQLLQSEMAFSEMMMAVQQELARAVGLEAPEDAAEAPEAPPAEELPKQAPRSKLWVPGQR